MNNELDYPQLLFDEYADLYDKLEELKSEFPEYKINLLTEFGNHFIQVEKKDELFLLDIITSEIVPVGHFTAIINNLNGSEFVLFQDDESALFSSEGKQMTPYRKGEFSFEINYNDFRNEKIIIDMSNNKKIIL